MATNARLKAFGAFALIFLGAALLSGCTAPTVCEGMAMSSGFTQLWTTWQGLIIVGVTMIFTVSGFVYMLSNLVSHRGLMTWAKNQFYEGIVTLVLAFFIITIMGITCSMDVTILDVSCDNPGNCDPFHVAENYLEQFRDSTSNFFWGIFVVNMFISAIASTTLSFVVTGLGPSLSVGQGLSFFTNQFSTGMTLVAGMQLLTMLQILLLKISAKLFGILLPAGVLLRSFGITRGFGGSLIALALGFYLIYPLMIVLSYGMLQDKIDAQFAADPGGNLPKGPDGWTDTTSFFCGFLGLLIVGAVLIPFIVFVVLVAFIKGLSGALGEEVDVSNLTRLV